MSKASHHRKKKAHAKMRKGRHKVTSRRNAPSMGAFSSLKHKLYRINSICHRLLAIVLCLLMFLSFSVPAISAFMQGSLSASSNKASRQSEILAQQSLKQILTNSIIFTQNGIRSIIDLQEKALETIIPEPVETEEVLETIIPEPVETEEVPNETGIPNVVYLHSRQSNIPYISAFPEVVEERLSEDDIAVDLSQAFDPGIVYDCSAELEDVFCRIVEREAGNQPFLGMLLIAEGAVSRVFSGAYGPSAMVNAILHQGYLAQEDSNGKLHIYLGGKEIIAYSEEVQKAVRLALNGSRVSHTILKAVTELQNTKHGLQLDDTYYQWGTIYHYSPADVTMSQLRARSIRRAPVSFQFVDHVLYGYWLPASLQLNL